ncbi:hypothetical protein NA57DRAFT_81313 [Rhizodiscina lignyota]|uniref:Uncharacterized protein n=1 Tax=Rhizodiscina lignyota TaxID=1504668 RepID=A0A9P4M1F2_9PEZI|nr:hypothetical protein NA57DRAFT_81313 [Rhizodiscina lignyota]
MDALGTILVGQIDTSLFLGPAGTSSDVGDLNVETIHTSVMTTSLVNSDELNPIFEFLETCTNGRSSCPYYETNGSLGITPPATQAPLSQAIEQLFQNITVSLLSNSRFLTPPASSPPTTITMFFPQNWYVYTWWRLVAPYAVALLFNLIGCALGLRALHESRASYSQRFSTVLRVARSARLDGEYPSQEERERAKATGKVGADPLPKEMENAEVWLDENMETEEVGFNVINVKRRSSN